MRGSSSHARSHPLQKITRYHGFDWLSGIDQYVIRLAFDTGSSDLADEFLEFTKISLPDAGGLSDQFPVVLKPLEAPYAIERKIDFLRIENVKDRDVMTPKAKVVDSLGINHLGKF